jgi:hypothetical protein
MKETWLFVKADVIFLNKVNLVSNVKEQLRFFRGRLDNQ